MNVHLKSIRDFMGDITMDSECERSGLGTVLRNRLIKSPSGFPRGIPNVQDKRIIIPTSTEYDVAEK